MTTPTPKAYEFHVAVQLWAHADVTVVAESEEAAEQMVRDQFNEGSSSLTRDLAQQVSRQIYKEVKDESAELELRTTREATEDEVDEYEAEQGEDAA